MSQAAIEAFLRKKIGLEVLAIGSSTIAHILQQRLAVCGLPNLEVYLRKLQTSTVELEALVEDIVVSETWFFRDREAYRYLKKYVQLEWQPSYPNSVLRILSLPCSTGEEPYSIAITLQEAGLNSKNFSIDAVDISQKSLDYARRALYTRNSFRGNNLSFRKHYFSQTADGYQLLESISRTVKFSHGNLLEPQLPLLQKPYNVIFCRNLLIYLEQSAREKVVRMLDNLLVDNGRLFVGSSEAIPISSAKFVAVKYPLAFVFQKIAEKPDKLEKIEPVCLQKKPKNKATKTDKFPSKFPDLEITKSGRSGDSLVNQKLQENLSSSYRIPPNYPRLTKDSKPRETTLETARNLADQGQLKQAITLCENYLSHNRFNAEAHFLFGQLLQAKGNEREATEHFRKAVYLKPNHYEALIHLALLQETQGDFKGAAIIRQRLQRLRKSQSSYTT
ncbi:CheR family methyltransferase [Lyngbya aestuarii]|uniref:CheR family methyltransferase n=1 Tax=Lyngbya aestuarii TaxID=118322 RepID=UPI00403D7382